MAFTDRFIKVPVKEFSRLQKELTGNEELLDNWEKLDPDYIINYRPTLDDDGNPMEGTTVYTSDGREYVVRLHWREFEKRMNEFVNQRKQSAI